MRVHKHKNTRAHTHRHRHSRSKRICMHHIYTYPPRLVLFRFLSVTLSAVEFLKCGLLFDRITIQLPAHSAQRHWLFACMCVSASKDFRMILVQCVCVCVQNRWKMCIHFLYLCERSYAQNVMWCGYKIAWATRNIVQNMHAYMQTSEKKKHKMKKIPFQPIAMFSANS